MTNVEGSPNAQMTKATADVSSFGFRHSFDIRHSSFVIPRIFHSLANLAARLWIKFMFGYAARVYVLGRENVNHEVAFLLAANHISHFDPLILSSVVRRQSDWMPIEDF